MERPFSLGSLHSKILDKVHQEDSTLWLVNFTNFASLCSNEASSGWQGSANIVFQVLNWVSKKNNNKLKFLKFKNGKSRFQNCIPIIKEASSNFHQSSFPVYMHDAHLLINSSSPDLFGLSASKPPYNSFSICFWNNLPSGYLSLLKILKSFTSFNLSVILSSLLNSFNKLRKENNP